MSNRAHRRRQGHLPAEPPPRAGFFHRLLGLGPATPRTGAAVAGSASSRAEAELIAGFLRSHGIRAAVSADDEGGLNPALQSYQRVRVLVRPPELDRAKALLAEQQDDVGNQ